jgi:hypothetical protein
MVAAAVVSQLQERAESKNILFLCSLAVSVFGPLSLYGPLSLSLSLYFSLSVVFFLSRSLFLSPSLSYFRSLSLAFPPLSHSLPLDRGCSIENDGGF